MFMLALATNYAYAQGGTGHFVTDYVRNGEDEIQTTKGISFVRDGQANRYAWRPMEFQQADYSGLGQLFDIRNVKSIFRHVESDNQLSVDMPQEAPVDKDKITVQAYGKTIAPTEDNKYKTGANAVSVVNKEGRIIYECYVSLDTLNAQRSVEVNALETAYSLIIPIFPFALDATSDKILSSLKSLLAELPETHDLAAAIDRSVVKNGYLELNDVATEYKAVVDCIIDRLGLRDNYLKQGSRWASRRRSINLPTVIDGRSAYGLELRLDNSEWHVENGKKWWQGFFTAYNSNRFAYTAWTKGYKDAQGYAHLYDIDYEQLKDKILKPQRVSTFMDTFTTWDGLKRYWGDTYDLLVTEGFGFDDMTWDYTRKSFSLDFYNSNEVVCVLGPADDDTMLLYNLIHTFLGPILKKVSKGMTEDDDYIMSFILDLITDADYMYEFTKIVNGHHTFGVNAKEFIKLTWPKAKKHGLEYLDDQLYTKALENVWDHWGFKAAQELNKAYEEIEENWDLWLKKVEFWGDMFLGSIGLNEGNHYYNLSLDFDIEEANAIIETYTVNGATFDMVRVDGGNFLMGALNTDKKATASEKPRHEVSLSNFYIGETEVTQGLWEAVMGSNPSRFRGKDLPVENVSWLDCQEFIEKLNALTNRTFRLPTEAEWEYAARGGQYGLGYNYAGSIDLGTVAWYDKNGQNCTHPVGKKKPNELGLYDMSGNVYEWCMDYYDVNYYSHHHSLTPEKDPCNETVASLYAHVLRGGCWHWSDKYCRLSSRHHNGRNVKSEIFGLRLAMTDPGAAHGTMEVKPNEIRFGDVIIGQTGRERLTLTNTGTMTKRVRVEVPAPFEIEGAGTGENAKEYDVKPNSSTYVYILFTPKDEQAYSGYITIKSEALEQTMKVVAVSAKGAIEGVDYSFRLSTEDLQVCVDKTEVVEIFNGSGFYEIINKYQDIVETEIVGEAWHITGKKIGKAELILRDKGTDEILTLRVEVVFLDEVTPGEVIDMGLSVKWLSSNVGASKPESYGDYFAWGETQAKEDYRSSNYKWYANWAFTKYNDNDGKTVLDKEDDVAYVQSAGRYRMPTREEFLELLNNCVHDTIEYHGVKGMLFRAENGNSIFLPHAGYKGWGAVSHAEKEGYYWVSERISFEGDGYCQPLSSFYLYNDMSREYGLSVRAVQEPDVPVASMEISKEHIDFGRIPIGGKCFAYFAIKNTGKANLNLDFNVSSAELSVDFFGDDDFDNFDKIDPVAGRVVVHQEQTIFVRVHYSPTKTGSFSSVIRIKTNALRDDKIITIVGEGRNQDQEFATVDLGLSVKWANMNMGAEAPEKQGDLYAWGETETKESYTDCNYKWYKGCYGDVTKYCTDATYFFAGHDHYFGNVDNKTQLEPEDDAATAVLKSPWRMPTASDYQELLSGCEHFWGFLNDVEGCFFKGSTGETIFMKTGSVWTSTLSHPRWGSTFQLVNVINGAAYDPYTSRIYKNEREDGLEIRPVRP